MDLVDEKHVVILKIGEDRGEIAGLLQRRPRRHSQLAVHFMGDDAGQRRFSQAGRSVKEKMVQRFLALFCGLDINFQLGFYLRLAVEIG